MPEDKPQNSKDINIQVGGDTTLEGVAIGDRNKIINRVQEIHGHVIQADHSQVHIGDIYYYFEIPKSEVIKKEPYKFLSTYGIEDKDIFFGRKMAIEELCAQILSQKLVIVNGKSGSGKSSLIHAGVTPKLLRNNHLVIHITDYLTSPVNTIEEAIHGGLESSLVIFLDQFERFFIYLSAERQYQFAAALKGWLEDKTFRVRFVLAIRMDFFGRLGEFQKVIRDIYQQSYIFTVEPLSRDEAREAIESPLEVLGIRIVYEKTLLDTLLDRLLEEEEIEPAQLQVVCYELYRTTKERSAHIINAGIYNELGGVQGILETYLQRKLQEYKPQDEAVKAILKQMIAPVGVSAGIRTFVEIPQIAERLKMPEDQVTSLIERLRDDRLIEKKKGEDSYSVAHEYMAGQIQRWFDPQETAIRRAKDILTHAMSYNVLMPYEEASQVKEYEQELELTAEEHVFLKKSLNKHYRWVWFRRGLVTAITLFAMIATALGWYANIQRSDAVYQREQAEKSRKEAENQKEEAIKARDEAERQKEQAEQAEKEANLQLARNYWSNGVNERDQNNDLLKAGHYFIKAAELAALADDPAFSKNAQLAGDTLTRSIHLGAILEHQDTVLGAVFSLDETRILTWSADGTARVWDLQADYDFSRELLILRLEVQTGTRLTDVGDLEALSPEEWWEEKRQYEEIDREHLKTGNYPRANLFLNYLMKCPGSCDRPGEWLQEVNPDVVSEAAFKYARICLNRGSFYLNLKKYDQAVRAFETSRQLLTTHPSKSQRSLAEAYERSGRTFIESGQDVEKGIEYVRKSLELSPYQEPELAPETLALGYIAQEQYAEAVAWLEEQLKQFPDNKTLLQCLEEAKEGLGE